MVGDIESAGHYLCLICDHELLMVADEVSNVPAWQKFADFPPGAQNWREEAFACITAECIDDKMHIDAALRCSDQCPAHFCAGVVRLEHIEAQLKRALCIIDQIDQRSEPLVA